VRHGAGCLLISGSRGPNPLGGAVASGLIRTARLSRAVFRKALADAVRLGHLAFNVVDRTTAPPPVPRRPVTPYTLAEVDALAPYEAAFAAACDAAGTDTLKAGPYLIRRTAVPGRATIDWDAAVAAGAADPAALAPFTRTTAGYTRWTLTERSAS